ncbi:hypothetical protein [Phenylobacterium terrae]
MAGSATCIWDNLSQSSRDWAFSIYKPDGSLRDEDAPPPDEEFERAATACGHEITDETFTYLTAAAGGIALKKAAAARLKTLAGLDETTLDSHWLALSAKQRQAAEAYVLAGDSESPPKEDDLRPMLFMGLYVLAGWTPVAEDPLLPHFVNYYAGLVSASAYEKLF